MVNQEHFEAQHNNDAAQEVEKNTLNIFLLEANQSMLGANRRQNDTLADNLLPAVELLETKQTRVAKVEVAKTNATKPETLGQKTEASERTEKAVARGIQNSELSTDDKKVATAMAKAIAEGDTGKLQAVVDKLGTTKQGREQLKRVVGALNEAYDDGGIRDINLSYPVKDENGTHWELEVQGKGKSGIDKYVYVKPGERPVSSTQYGPHGDLDRGDTPEVNKMQERDASKALSAITDHGQERLAEKERKAKEARQQAYERELEQLRREIMSR